jgi:hypothetical protein
LHSNPSLQLIFNEFTKQRHAPPQSTAPAVTEEQEIKRLESILTDIEVAEIEIAPALKVPDVRVEETRIPRNVQ